jgi:hydroxymethylbilane synthase
MSATARLRIGTRGSALAVWQAEHVASLLRVTAAHTQIEIVRIATTGDIVADVPLSQVPGKAFFTKELDDALLDGRIDLAVHSLKDVAVELPAGIALAAIPQREDPRDALVSASGAKRLADLPAGARIGTSSVRRRAFVRRLRPDLEPVELRGNVPTRVQKVDDGALDAVILATAGLNRLGLAERIGGHLDPADFPPAAAQGALGVCARREDAAVLEALAALDHGESRIATAAERAFLRELEAGCQVPAGVLGTVRGDRLHLRAAMCEPDGTRWATAALEVAVHDAQSGGRALATDLVARSGRPRR